MLFLEVLRIREFYEWSKNRDQVEPFTWHWIGRFHCFWYRFDFHKFMLSRLQKDFFYRAGTISFLFPIWPSKQIYSDRPIFLDFFTNEPPLPTDNLPILLSYRLLTSPPVPTAHCTEQGYRHKTPVLGVTVCSLVLRPDKASHEPLWYFLERCATYSVEESTVLSNSLVLQTSEGLYRPVRIL